MKKISFLMMTSFFACLLSVFTGCAKKSDRKEITLLAAASLTDVCGQLKTAFESENKNISLLFSFGSSGALQAQIEAGAPCDIFISAAKKQMNVLVEKNLIKKESVKNLLENQVVLILPEESSLEISSFEDLALPSVKMIAIGNPESVPVGQYTKAIYENLGLWNEIAEKANLASDVRTALFWTESASVDAGIVYATDAALSDRVKVVASAPEGSCPKVIYPAGIINKSENAEEAEKIMTFLTSPEAEKIFTEAGFSLCKD